MSRNLTKLICGAANDASDLCKVISHLGQTLDLLLEQARWLSEQDDKKVAAFGPYIGRSLLEIAVTAIAARLDPFRVLVLRRVQMEQDYNIRNTYRSAVRWQDDILGDKKNNDMWSPTVRFSEVSRALLGDYYDNVYWQAAQQILIDQTDTLDGGDWLGELRLIEPCQFTPRIKSESAKLYSSLSKGVHQEFVVPLATKYDRATVQDLINNVLRVIGHLGLVSHFVLHSPFRHAPTDAIVMYKAVQIEEVV